MFTAIRQLRSTLPGVFDAEDHENRLAVVRQMLTAYHYRRQIESNRKNKEKQNDVIDLTGDSDGSEDGESDEGDYDVAHFLEACIPPMTRFLVPLMEYGLDLRTASTLPIETFGLTLDSALGSGEGKMTRMEKMVLQNHLLIYFGKAQA